MSEESKALTKLPRNKRELAKLYDRTFVQRAPELLEATFTALVEQVRKGDSKAISTAAEVLKLTKGQGVQVNVQQNNNNVTVAPTRDRTAEAIIRKLEARKFLDRKASEEAVDAEFTDLPNAS